MLSLTLMDQKEWLEFCHSNSICPQCGTTIEEGKGVGTGNFSDGVFCSIPCYSAYRIETDD